MTIPLIRSLTGAELFEQRNKAKKEAILQELAIIFLCQAFYIHTSNFVVFSAIKSLEFHVPLFALCIGSKIPNAVPQLTQRLTSELLPARLHI
jgi:hypothetical protein